jgi:hypothetical protein
MQAIENATASIDGSGTAYQGSRLQRLSNIQLTGPLRLDVQDNKERQMERKTRE